MTNRLAESAGDHDLSLPLARDIATLCGMPIGAIFGDADA